MCALFIYLCIDLLLFQYLVMNTSFYLLVDNVKKISIIVFYLLELSCGMLTTSFTVIKQQRYNHYDNNNYSFYKVF